MQYHTTPLLFYITWLGFLCRFMLSPAESTINQGRSADLLRLALADEFEAPSCQPR